MIVAVRKSVAEVAVVGSVGTEKTKPQIVSPVPRHVAHSEIRHTRPELTTVESKVVTEKAHARRGQSIFVLGTLFGGLLVLTAVMGTHLSSNTSTAPATNSSSALSRISNSGPSDQFAVPASYIAELEGVQSDGGTSVSRPTSTLLAQDPPQHQPDVRRTSRAALLIERVEPKYPLVAKEEHLGGAVTVEATIAMDGVPHVLRFVGGELRLAEAAMAAISLWRYKPALLGGQPVESQINITVNFEYKP